MLVTFLSWLLVTAATTYGCIQTSLRAEVVCHLEGDLDPSLIDPCKCTILVVKGVSIGNESSVTADVDLNFIAGFRERNPQLKVLSSFVFKNLGVFSSPQSIGNFSSQISNFVESENLDGVEIDFRDAELIKNSDDVTSVMKVIRLSLDQRIHKISKREVSSDQRRRRLKNRGHIRWRRGRKKIAKTDTRKSAGNTRRTDSNSRNTTIYNKKGNSRGTVKFQDYFDKRILQSIGEKITPVQSQTRWTIPDKTPPVSIVRPLEERIGNGKILMLTLPSNPRQLVKGYDMKELSRIVDLFSVPSHNFTSPSHSAVTYHHSRLMGVSDLENADSMLDLIVSMGIPLDRLVMGIPTFAGLFMLKDESINAPRSEVIQDPVWISYSEVCKLMSDGNWTIERDDDLTAPFAFNNNSWIAFDDPISIKIKSKYALLRGLAGIGIYNLENDDFSGNGDQDSFPLLESVSRTFTHLSRRPRSAILKSLVDDLDFSATNGQPSFAAASNIKSSPFRIVRVVDRTGTIKAIRSDSDTRHECSRQGYYRDSEDCSHFYRCVKFDQYVDDFTVFEYNCPTGLVFDDRWEVCSWPSAAPACDGSSEIFPIPRQRNICTQEGYFVDPENCRWFFACKDYYGNDEFTVYEFRCPFGLAYDERNKKCNWPWLVASCETQAKTSEGRSRGKAIFEADSKLQEISNDNFAKECINCNGAEIGITGNGILHKEKGIIVSPEYFEKRSKTSFVNNNAPLVQKAQHFSQQLNKPIRNKSPRTHIDELHNINGGSIFDNKSKLQIKGRQNNKHNIGQVRMSINSNNEQVPTIENSDFISPVVVTSSLEGNNFQKALFVTKTTDGPNNRIGSTGRISLIPKIKEDTSSEYSEEKAPFRGETTFGSHHSTPELSLFTKKDIKTNIQNINNKNAFHSTDENRKISGNNDRGSIHQRIFNNKHKNINVKNTNKHHQVANHHDQKISDIHFNKNNKSKVTNIENARKHSIHQNTKQINNKLKSLQTTNVTPFENQSFNEKKEDGLNSYGDIDINPTFVKANSKGNFQQNNIKVRPQPFSSVKFPDEASHQSDEDTHFNDFIIENDKKLTFSNIGGKNNNVKNDVHFPSRSPSHHPGDNINNNFSKNKRISTQSNQKNVVNSGFAYNQDIGKSVIKSTSPKQRTSIKSDNRNVGRIKNIKSISGMKQLHGIVENEEGIAKHTDRTLPASRINNFNFRPEERKTFSQFSELSSQRGDENKKMTGFHERNKHENMKITGFHERNRQENMEKENLPSDKRRKNPDFNKNFRNHRIDNKNSFSKTRGSFSQTSPNDEMSKNIELQSRDQIHQFKTSGVGNLNERTPVLQSADHSINKTKQHQFFNQNNTPKLRGLSPPKLDHIHFNTDINKFKSIPIPKTTEILRSPLKPFANLKTDHFTISNHKFSPKTGLDFGNQKEERIGEIKISSGTQKGNIEKNSQFFKSLPLKPIHTVHHSSHQQQLNDFNADININLNSGHFNSIPIRNTNGGDDHSHREHVINTKTRDNSFINIPIRNINMKNENYPTIPIKNTNTRDDTFHNSQIGITHTTDEEDGQPINNKFTLKSIPGLTSKQVNNKFKFNKPDSINTNEPAHFTSKQDKTSFFTLPNNRKSIGTFSDLDKHQSPKSFISHSFPSKSIGQSFSDISRKSLTNDLQNGGGVLPTISSFSDKTSKKNTHSKIFSNIPFSNKKFPAVTSETLKPLNTKHNDDSSFLNIRSHPFSAGRLESHNSKVTGSASFLNKPSHTFISGNLKNTNSKSVSDISFSNKPFQKFPSESLTNINTKNIGIISESNDQTNRDSSDSLKNTNSKNVGNFLFSNKPPHTTSSDSLKNSYSGNDGDIPLFNKHSNPVSSGAWKHHNFKAIDGITFSKKSPEINISDSLKNKNSNSNTFSSNKALHTISSDNLKNSHSGNDGEIPLFNKHSNPVSFGGWKHYNSKAIDGITFSHKSPQINISDSLKNKNSNSDTYLSNKALHTISSDHLKNINSKDVDTTSLSDTLSHTHFSDRLNIHSDKVGSTSFSNRPSHSISSDRFTNKNIGSHGLKSHHSNLHTNQDRPHAISNGFTHTISSGLKDNNKDGDSFKINNGIFNTEDNDHRLNFDVAGQAKLRETNIKIGKINNRNLDKHKIFKSNVPPQNINSNPKNHFTLPKVISGSNFNRNSNIEKHHTAKHLQNQAKGLLNKNHESGRVELTPNKHKQPISNFFEKNTKNIGVFDHKVNLKTSSESSQFDGISSSSGFGSVGENRFPHTDKKLLITPKGKTLHNGLNETSFHSQSRLGVGIRKPIFREPSLLSKFRNNIPFQRHAPFGEKVYDDDLGPEVCERAGLFRHPESCDKFYECYWDKWIRQFTLHVFVCPITIIYDSGITACNWPFAGPPCTDKNHP